MSLYAMMPVYNEADRYLKHVLNHLSDFVNRIVILDDGSTDRTPKLCRSYDKVIYYRNEHRTFERNEPALRRQLWEHTVELKPDWILAIDADEVFEERAKVEFATLLDETEYSVVDFRLFDFWESNKYRIDCGWNPWVKNHRMLVKYDPSITSVWSERLLHGGRFPQQYYDIPYAFQSDLRVKHFGWMDIHDRQRKYDFYIEQLPDNKHTQSIIDPDEKIQLEEWIPCKTLQFLSK